MDDMSRMNLRKQGNSASESPAGKATLAAWGLLEVLRETTTCGRRQDWQRETSAFSWVTCEDIWLSRRTAPASETRAADPLLAGQTAPAAAFRGRGNPNSLIARKLVSL